jgi:hypothetical protein
MDAAGDLNDETEGLSQDSMDTNLDDPNISSLPRVLLMGPRRGGKTSIQVRTFVYELCMGKTVWAVLYAICDTPA